VSTTSCFCFRVSLSPCFYGRVYNILFLGPCQPVVLFLRPCLQHPVSGSVSACRLVSTAVSTTSCFCVRVSLSPCFYGRVYNILFLGPCQPVVLFLRPYLQHPVSGSVSACSLVSTAVSTTSCFWVRVSLSPCFYGRVYNIVFLGPCQPLALFLRPCLQHPVSGSVSACSLVSTAVSTTSCFWVRVSL
jgi:hypothetical protein